MIPPSQQRETTGHTPQGTIVSRFCAITSLLTYININKTTYARNEPRELCMQRTVTCSIIGYKRIYCECEEKRSVLTLYKIRPRDECVTPDRVLTAENATDLQQIHV